MARLDSHGLVKALCGTAVILGSVAIAFRLLRRDPLPAASIAPHLDQPQGMVRIPGGRFQMGYDHSYLVAQRPIHEVTVAPFLMDAHEVTNADFARFVADTEYVTTAERTGRAWVYRITQTRWLLVDGADWRHPRGPNSSIAGREDYPVVQVSWFDAVAYAQWRGKRLPTEAEWEFAARGGWNEADFPWGADETPTGDYEANYRQAADADETADGFAGLAPTCSYRPNPFGLHDMAGNVWEGCGDWYGEDYYHTSPADNPTGPAAGRYRVTRGGSWLTSDQDINRLKVWTRDHQLPESGHNHVGFRCVRDIVR